MLSRRKRMKSYTPMIKQYLSIKAEHDDAFLFFRLGDFYEMFFEDAIEAAKLLEIALTARGGGVGEKIPMCGVPHHAAESYISRLIELGHKVAICEQVEDPKEAKGIVRREVTRVITPGTIIEGERLDDQSNNYICSIASDGTMIGLAVADFSTGEFYATEFLTDSGQLLNELYLYNPSELLLTDELFNKHKKEFLQINAAVTHYELDSKNNYQQLIKDQFAKQQLQLTPIMERSVGALLVYIKSNQRRTLSHLSQLTLYDNNKYLILDPFSKRNLELTQTSREQKKHGSLLWLLDKTETAMGKRELKRWLEKPLLAQTEIEARQEIVAELLADLILSKDLAERLNQVYDVERLVAKTAYGNINARELYNLRKSLEQINDIAQLIERSEATILQDLFAKIDQCIDVSALIERAIVDDPPILSKDGGVIKRGFNEKLDDYYLIRSASKEWLKRLEQSERELTGIKSLKVRYNRIFGYYIEVTRSNLAQVPKDRYIRKQTLANAERFITEELKIKETAILEAEEKTLELEYQLFVQVRELVAAESARLLQLAQLIARLDVLHAFAKLSSNKNYVRPNFNNDGVIKIEAGRHPVIEALNRQEYFFPNDALLKQDENQILIITGPNMSGKSTYMRQIALIAIMAQIGCYVPASSASMPLVDRIFTRIGAGDDLTGGYSTFMVEMMETKQALTEATPNSLILLDEIGRGTSTYDGMALAQAILQYIHDVVDAKTLFSTHYHELTALADTHHKIKNIQVTVMEHNNQIIFLHKIKEGSADKSYGIHVAELAGLPAPIINNAKSILKEIEANRREYQIRLDFSTENKEPAKTARSEESPQELELLTELAEVDLNQLTPLEVVSLVDEFQQRLDKLKAK